MFLYLWSLWWWYFLWQEQLVSTPAHADLFYLSPHISPHSYQLCWKPSPELAQFWAPHCPLRIGRLVGSIIFPPQSYQRDRSADHRCGSQWLSLRYCSHSHDLTQQRLIKDCLGHWGSVLASTSSDYHWIVTKYRTVVFPKYPRIKVIDGRFCFTVVAPIQIL